MRTKNTSNLNLHQKQNRSKILGHLHNYWKEENFPINTTHKERIPQIKDKSGTLCALAYILHNSGKQKLVEDIAKQNNYVRVKDVPRYHPLNHTIEENGFTKKEAEKIQPMYGNCLVLANQAPLYEPALVFLTTVLSIAGIAIALSVYGVSAKTNVRSSIVAAIVITLIGTASFVGFNQNTSAYSFSDYLGEMQVYSFGDSHSIFYWINGGKVVDVSSDYNVILKIDATTEGQVIVATPGIIREELENESKFLEEGDFFVLVNGEEVLAEQSFESQHYVLKVPFKEGKNEIELIPGGLCRYILSDKELKNYP